MDELGRSVCRTEKDWKELSIEEKIERTRSVLKDMMRIVEYQEKNLRFLRDSFDCHRHDKSEILFSRYNPRTESLDLCRASKDEKYF